MILIFDVLTSILQAFFIAITIHKCLTKQKKSKIILITILIFFISFYFTSKFGNLSLCVLITHLLTILAVALIYKSRKKESIVAFSIAYCFLSLIIIIFSNIYFGFLKERVVESQQEIAQIITIYLTQITFITIFLKNIVKVKELYNQIISESRNVILLITTSFIVDIVVASKVIIYNNESKLLKNVVVLILCIYLIVMISYFARIKQRADEIFYQVP